MSYTLVFIPAALKEYQEAYDWYDAQSIGLGATFEQKVEECLSKMALNPELHSSTDKKYRKARVDIFPYLIIYKINKKNNTLHIHSIFHTSRKPKKKYRKL